MKFYNRPTWWALVIGIILVVMYTGSLGTSLGNPIGIEKIDFASRLMDFAFMLFGAFLVGIFVKKKLNDDITVNDIPTTNDETLVLKRQRAWITAIFIIFTLPGSVDVWFLNDYGAGLSAVNLSIIFDLIASIILLFCVIQLLRKIEMTPFYMPPMLVAYSIIGSVFEFAKDNPYDASYYILMGVYFAFAFYTPLTKKNHRLAQMVLLPIVVVSCAVTTDFQNRNLSRLQTQEVTIRGNFISSTDSLSGQYVNLLQRESIDAKDIAATRGVLDQRNIRLAEYKMILELITAEYSEQTITVSQQATLLQYRYINDQLELHKNQSDKLYALLTLLDEEIGTQESAKQARIGTMISEIDSFSPPLVELDLKIANLNDYI